MQPLYPLIAAVLVALCTTLAFKPASAREPLADAPIAAPNIAALMPRHGTVSTVPAEKWEDALIAGNGIQGAMLYGSPTDDTVLVNHCKLWLPAGSREVVPDVGKYLPEMRQIIGAQGYEAGQRFFFEKAKEQGWGGKLVWTDAFHPGFFLRLQQPQTGPITDYARIENFSTGEVRTQWSADGGAYSRRMFVSRPDNVVAVTTTGPAGKVSVTITMEKLDSALIDSTVTHGADGWITCHNIYVHGKGGYDGAVRVVSDGGTRTTDGHSITVSGANSVTLLIRILPYRTPLTDSAAWPTNPSNPDFTHPLPPARKTVQVAGPAYDPAWGAFVRHDLESLSPDYEKLFQSHAREWSRIYDRVSVDLGGSVEERGMSSEALLDRAQKNQKLSPALLERMYDAGRYVFFCSAGPETPPNLFGIWTGTWHPAWSGDYTTDTNLQLDVECAYTGNMAESMAGYFHLLDSLKPDLETNAHNLYGCRGILTGSRISNNGLSLHWDEGWPGNLWTPGAPWIAHWYYDYYQYTGDRAFLRDRAIPFMKDCALFYEDFLKGTEDANGHYQFRPSFSAENGWGDNSSQDIEIAQELLTNLITGCETLGIEQDGVARWKALLAKLPPLLINSQGQLKEWSNPTQGEQNNHRHLMHLYGAFESEMFSEEADPRIFAAARVALINRVNASTEDAAHGFMHTGLAAAGLGMGNLAYARVEQLAKRRSIYPSMIDGHLGGPGTLCDDGNGATPEIVARMLYQSQIGRLALLPALPDALPHGNISGVRARGAITIDRLAWDTAAGSLSVSLTPDLSQTVTIVLPPGVTIRGVTVNGKPQAVSVKGVGKQGFDLNLRARKNVKVEVQFTGVPVGGV